MSQRDDGVQRYAYSVVTAAYMDKAKTSSPSCAMVANFATAAQGTIGLQILTEKLDEVQAESLTKLHSAVIHTTGGTQAGRLEESWPR